ncbi:MAG TPA: GAF domain-containing protein [Terriglobales bacterium]|nr:GAF domain-containing protein [Terriglobales bacterium]
MTPAFVEAKLATSVSKSPMDAYSIAECSGQDALLAPATLTRLVNANGLGEHGKGLSIVDSARRDLEATLQLLADRAQYITGAAGAAIALRDGDKVLCRASSGTAAPDLGSCLDLSSGLSGECVRTRTALRCDDVSRDPRVDRESCRRLGIASLAVMPILRNGEVIGIFEIFSSKPGAFQERDLAALERLREMVNTALDEASPERAQHSVFAVHGPKMKAIAAAAGVGNGAVGIAGATNSRTQADNESFIAGLPGTPERHTETGMDLDRINSCTRCGFPVSEGRRLCLDCEEKGISVGDPGVQALAGTASGEMKAWLMMNRYVIGMVLISAATIAFALLR